MTEDSTIPQNNTKQSDNTPSEYYTSVGNYLIGKTIGKGTFGKVKLGKHKITQEKVAVKILEKDKILDDSDRVRIQREIQILRKVRHPNIIQLYEIIETPKKLFLIMEFVPNGELFDLIVKKARLREKVASQYFQQIMSALEYLHQLGIVHRDLKPENLLLDHNNEIKVVDFGLSNLYSPGQELKTACGSPCYAAPEMVSGKKYHGSKTDIWSAGIILYAMLCGYLPFEDKNTSKLYQLIIEGNYKLPSWITERAQQMLQGVLNTNPNNRFTYHQIMAHKFVTHNGVLPLKNGIITSKHEIPIDLQIVDTISKQYDMDSNQIIQMVKQNKHNTTTSTYYLTLKNVLENKGKSPADLKYHDPIPLKIPIDKENIISQQQIKSPLKSSQLKSPLKQQNTSKDKQPLKSPLKQSQQQESNNNNNTDLKQQIQDIKQSMNNNNNNNSPLKKSIDKKSQQQQQYSQSYQNSGQRSSTYNPQLYQTIELRNSKDSNSTNKKDNNNSLNFSQNSTIQNNIGNLDQGNILISQNNNNNNQQQLANKPTLDQQQQLQNSQDSNSKKEQILNKISQEIDNNNQKAIISQQVQQKQRHLKQQMLESQQSQNSNTKKSDITILPQVPQYVTTPQKNSLQKNSITSNHNTNQDIFQNKNNKLNITNNNFNINKQKRQKSITIQGNSNKNQSFYQANLIKNPQDTSTQQQNKKNLSLNNNNNNLPLSSNNGSQEQKIRSKTMYKQKFQTSKNTNNNSNFVNQFMQKSPYLQNNFQLQFQNQQQQQQQDLFLLSNQQKTSNKIYNTKKSRDNTPSSHQQQYTQNQFYNIQQKSTSYNPHHNHRRKRNLIGSQEYNQNNNDLNYQESVLKDQSDELELLPQNIRENSQYSAKQQYKPPRYLSNQIPNNIDLTNSNSQQTRKKGHNRFNSNTVGMRNSIYNQTGNRFNVQQNSNTNNNGNFLKKGYTNQITSQNNNNNKQFLLPQQYFNNSNQQSNQNNNSNNKYHKKNIKSMQVSLNNSQINNYPNTTVNQSFANNTIQNNNQENKKNVIINNHNKKLRSITNNNKLQQSQLKKQPNQQQLMDINSTKQKQQLQYTYNISKHNQSRDSSY